MTPPPLQGIPSTSLAELSAASAQRAFAQLSRLQQELGRPLSRTARLLRTKAGWQPGLRSLLISDLYGAELPVAGVPSMLSARFQQLLVPLLAAWPQAAEDPRITGVAAQLATIAALEPAVRAGDDAACGQALGAAISVDLLLQELVHELASSHATALHS